jgi:hypothetical protein
MTKEQAVAYIIFLDALRASGETNMFGAGPYLREKFGLSRDESHQVLSAWMKIDLTKPISERAAALEPKP